MDRYQEIFDNLTDELVETTLQTMMDDPDVKSSNDTCKKVSRLIQDEPSLTKEVRAWIDEYFAAMQLLADKQHRYLYLQGARDFARLLKDFGVIPPFETTTPKP